ncbi:MAG: hypothetical protein EOO04_33250 [Chitinophagaceae bacterium]|nr:MAG: hypothetical protein EOO04_33250 [Chitinophagaceae bacterium]
MISLRNISTDVTTNISANGLAAAIVFRKKGASVLILEAKETIGGGLRTGTIIHQTCAEQISLQNFRPGYLYLLRFNTPGWGVHGMCGYHAEKRVLNDFDFR